MRNYKSICCAIALAAVQSVCAQGFVDFDGASSAAKAANKDIVVLVHGSDWNRRGEAFKRNVWDTDKFRKTLPKVVFLSLDMKETISDEEREAFLKKNEGFFKKLSIEKIHNLPALVYSDSKGFAIDWIKGIKPDTDVEALQKRLRGFAARRKERDVHWQRASKTKGLEKVVNLGKGLEAVAEGLHFLYGDTIKTMKKLDKNDDSGYILRFTFKAQSIWGKEINPLVKKKQYDDALAAVSKLLKNDKLLLEQRQRLMAMTYAVYNAWKGHQKEAMATLDDIVRLNPQSNTGKAASHLMKITKR